MANTFYTSDLHIDHERVANLRGFKTAKAHNVALAARWASVVKDDDLVYVLGDLCMGDPTYALSMIYDLPGRKRLVLGNHDAAHPMHKRSYRYQLAYFESFETVQIAGRTSVNGIDTLLSHFPYATDHTDVPRYTQWRLRDEGQWLLHGHTHGQERRHGHEVHIGLDAWDLTPVSSQQLAALMKE